MLTGLVQAQPANDLFANRTLLAGANVTAQGSNVGARIEPGEPTPSSTLLAHSVWYSWRAPTNGVLRISGSTSNFFLDLTAYRGTLGNLVAAPANADGGVPVQANERIELRVASVGTLGGPLPPGAGSFMIGLVLETPAAPSANDAFADRVEITGPKFHFNGDISEATVEAGEPLPEGAGTLWWKIAPAQPQLLTLSIFGTLASNLAVYEGSQLNSVVKIDPFDSSRFRLQPGREYAIQLAKAHSATFGTFTLDARLQSLGNDMFAASEQLAGSFVTYEGNGRFATSERGEPPAAGSNTVWASWTAPVTGRVQGGMTPSNVRVFTGSAVTNLEAVTVYHFQGYSFLAREGATYHFQFSRFADDFTFQFQFAPLTNTINDHFADAKVLKGRAVSSESVSISQATMEFAEPLHLGDVPQKSLWWRWQAPTHGRSAVDARQSVIPDVVLAGYEGPTLEALTLVGKGTNNLFIPVRGGETYCIAASVPGDALGDIVLQGQSGGAPQSIAVPGNLLLEPSWEGTALSPQHWHFSGPYGGYVNEWGGADGTTWPSIGTGTRFWQDFTVTTGRTYAVRFAHLIGNSLSACCGASHLRVLWNQQQLGIAAIPVDEGGYWHWTEYTVTATNASVRLTFENIGAPVEVDALSVVDMSAPPVIVNQPSSISTVSEGTAAFIVGAKGTPPLSHQWYLNGAPVAGQTNFALILNSVTPAHAGTYTVTITNGFGQVTSSPAVLAVDSDTNVTIRVQPYGDVVPVGGYFNLSVVAAGTPPLRYQWFRNDERIDSATNRNLMFTNVQPSDAGAYEVRVQNAGGTVWSLPARLSVATNVLGGATIDFRNRFTMVTSNEAPVFDLGGLARLQGEQYVAQLYAGRSLETMRAVGRPTPFQSGFNAGFFIPQLVTLANIAPGEIAFAQVRAWEIARGSSYEEARATGGKFGRSQVLQVATRPSSERAITMDDLQSFSLQAGLPQFTVGAITLVERQSPNTIVWSLQGEPGFRYVVERSQQNDDSVWRPYAVLTNVTGTVTFTDSASSGSRATLYRARILD